MKNGSLGPALRLLAPPDAAPAVEGRPPRLHPGDSLVTSAVAELAEFVRAENVKSLVAHLVEVHGDALRRSPLHRPLLEGLETRHAQNRDVLERASRGLPATEDQRMTSAQLERQRRIATEDQDEASARRRPSRTEFPRRGLGGPRNIHVAAAASPRLAPDSATTTSPPRRRRDPPPRRRAGRSPSLFAAAAQTQNECRSSITRSVMSMISKTPSPGSFDVVVGMELVT